MEDSVISPNQIEELIFDHLGYFNFLCESEKRQLILIVTKFLAEKTFEGCNGLVVKAEMRIIISALACLLILGYSESPIFPNVSTILLYPSAFSNKNSNYSEEQQKILLGEAREKDFVILSWPSVLQGIEKNNDGRNVALHEFAHQIDILDGRYDGLVPIGDMQTAIAWEKEITKEYQHLRREVSEGKKTFFDQYGATNLAEFFAVATEHFFEQPIEFHKKHLKVYELFRYFYRQDPMKRLEKNYTPSEVFQIPEFVYETEEYRHSQKIVTKGEKSLRHMLVGITLIAPVVVYLLGYFPIYSIALIVCLTLFSALLLKKRK